jgi:hypothetical protein
MRIHEARRIWERQMDDTDIDSQLPFHIWLKDFERIEGAVDPLPLTLARQPFVGCGESTH